VGAAVYAHVLGWPADLRKPLLLHAAALRAAPGNGTKVVMLGLPEGGGGVGGAGGEEDTVAFASCDGDGSDGSISDYGGGDSGSYCGGGGNGGLQWKALAGGGMAVQLPLFAPGRAPSDIGFVLRVTGAAPGMMMVAGAGAGPAGSQGGGGQQSKRKGKQRQRRPVVAEEECDFE
jgi:hypothetical protein